MIDLHSNDLSGAIKGLDRNVATTILLILAVIGVCAVGALTFGASRWQRKTNDIRARMQAANLPVTLGRYSEREIVGLPPLVRQYFRAVLQDGQAIVSGARLSQEGRFRPDMDEWRPFTATQFVTTRPPGFDWDARISMAPGVTAYVHDTYVLGEGMLQVKALGLFNVADVRGTPEAAQGELLRYLAESVWYPTALLPSQGVRWESMDDSNAKATLTNGATTVALEFCFDSDGLITSFKATSRCRGVIDGVPEFAPWNGRFWAYEDRDGLRIPLEGEVAWQMPAGYSPYCRVRITDINHEFAR